MKTIKSIFLTAMVMLMIGTMPLMAQTEEDKVESKHDREAMMERIKSAKIAHISKSVELTPEEAEKFWPLYNEFENKRNEITIDLFKRFKGGEEKPKDISDADADKLMSSRFSEEQALLDLKLEYHKKYLEILSASKVLKLYDTEDKFRRGLMERMGKGGSERGERRPEGGSERGGPREKPNCERRHYR
jgi:hypothetical protein